MLLETFNLESPNVQVTDEYITSTYAYETTTVQQNAAGAWSVRPVTQQYEFQVERRVPKTGCVVSKQQSLMFNP